MENKLVVVAMEEKDTGTGNGRNGDLVGGEALTRINQIILPYYKIIERKIKS